MNFYHGHKYLDLSKNLFQKILIQNCKKFPIKINPTKAQQTEITNLVDQLLQFNKDKQNATLPNQIEMLENRIEFAESKINQIVYELFELNEEEMAIVEASGKN